MATAYKSDKTIPSTSSSSTISERTVGSVRKGSSVKTARPVTGVCIDPGHGGTQPGAVSSKYSYQEKAIALDISLKVRDYLLYASKDDNGSIILNDYCPYPHSPLVDVMMTRENDIDVSLKDRCVKSNASKSSMFISIHCNSCTSEDPNGIETWCYPSEGSRKLANNIQSSLMESVSSYTIKVKGKEQSIKSRGVKETTIYYTLKNTDAPSVVVECGFMSNPSEVYLMYNAEDYRISLAKGIALGILKTLI